MVCVEHDLSVLDYLSDFICVLYGTPGVYGVVTLPFSVRDGINIFLAGFVPTENLRFRQVPLLLSLFACFFVVADARAAADVAVVQDVAAGRGRLRGQGLRGQGCALIMVALFAHFRLAHSPPQAARAPSSPRRSTPSPTPT